MTDTFLLKQKWYKSGQSAKTRNFARLSPFYENSTADYFFFCGFDGISFKEAVKSLEDKMNEMSSLLTEVA